MWVCLQMGLSKKVDCFLSVCLYFWLDSGCGQEESEDRLLLR